LEQIEEWNEFGELKGVIGDVPTNATSHVIAPATQTIKTTPSTAINPATATSTHPIIASATSKGSATVDDPAAAALRKAVFEAAATAKKPSTTTKATTKEPLETPTKEPTPTKDEPNVVEPPKSPVNDENPPAPIARKSSSTSSTTSRQYVPEHFDPAPLTHRGSSVSVVSDAEIKEIECASAIPEEDEDEDEDEVKQTVEGEKPQLKQTGLEDDVKDLKIEDKQVKENKDDKAEE
jgi:hypothetical protein